MDYSVLRSDESGYVTVYLKYAASAKLIIDEEDVFKQLLEGLFASNYQTFRTRDDRLQLIEALENLERHYLTQGEQNLRDVCQSEIGSLRAISLRQSCPDDIFTLAKHGDVAVIKGHIIKDKTLINRTTPEGASLLHIAAEFGYYHLARFLLSHGADVTVKDSNWKTPRELAIKKGHIYCKNLLSNPYFFVEAFVKKKASVSELKKFFRQEKELNIKVKNIFGMKEEVDAASFVNARVTFGNNPPRSLIHIAVDEMITEVVELLLMHGANPNFVDGQGNSPLHVAILNSLSVRVNVSASVKKLTEIALLLLRNGAAVDLKNHVGQSPFSLIDGRDQSNKISCMIIKAKKAYDCVIEKNSEELKKLLQTENFVMASFGVNRKSPLAIAIDAEDIETIKLLIEHQTGIIDLPDENGNQALHLAILAKKPKLVDFFLNLGARIEDKNAEGKTPCDLSKDHPLLFLANALMNDILYINDIYDKKISFKDENAREIELKRILDQLQINLNSEDAKLVIKVRSALNKTLLHLFCEHQVIPIPFFQRIIAIGAPLNIRNFRGSNPLHNIARNRLEDSKELLDLFYDTFKDEVKECMEMRDQQELKTPSMIAAMNGNILFIQWAKEKNLIDFSAKDEHGQTCLLLASASGKPLATKTVSFLLDCSSDPRVKDKHGNSCLLNAAKVGNIETIQILLEKGANVLDTDQKKRNLFHSLCRYGTFEQIFSFFDPKNLKIIKSWPLKELFDAYDDGERDSQPSRFYELLFHNQNLKKKQSMELDKRGKELLAMLEEQFVL